MRISDWSSDVCSSDLTAYGAGLTSLLRLAVPSSAPSNALSARHVRRRWMMSAPIAAANCWTGRSGHLICLEKIQPRLSGSIRASCDHCAHIGDRWLRQWWRGRHTGGHPDRYDAGRPCDDRHNRHYGAEHADRQSVVEGKSVSGRVDRGGSRNLKKKNYKT